MACVRSRNPFAGLHKHEECSCGKYCFHHRCYRCTVVHSAEILSGCRLYVQDNLYHHQSACHSLQSLVVRFFQNQVSQEDYHHHGCESDFCLHWYKLKHVFLVKN